MKDLRKTLKRARKLIKQKARGLPDQDAYATVYSLLADVAEEIDFFLKEIDRAAREAKAEVKKNPKQGTNRAKKWCRKP